jgi:hypothetical protein
VEKGKEKVLGRDGKKDAVVNAAFLFFETSKLWALIMYICRIDGKPKD